MWASEPGLGVQLTYGIYGNGTVALGEDLTTKEYSPEFQFPRLDEAIPKLSYIDLSRLELFPGQTEEETEHFTIMSWWRRRHLDTILVPDAIVEGLAAEATAFDTEAKVDPTVGDRVCFFSLGTAAYSDPIYLDGKRVYPKAKDNVMKLKGVATSCGEQGSRLKVNAVLPVRKTVMLKEKKRKLTVSEPASKLTASCDFPTEIKQISECPLVGLLAIRCESSIFLVRARWRNEPGNKGLDLQLWSRIYASQLDLGELAHIDVNQNKTAFDDILQMAVIDVDGNIRLLDFHENGDFSVLSFKNLRLHDPHDITYWKKVCWTHVPNVLLAFSRTLACLYVLNTQNEEAEQTHLITAHSWSEILDVQIKDQNVFLLTSKEIIWTQLKDKKLERLVSWKHFLDTNDPSFRLNLSQLDESFVCIVTSQDLVLSIVYTFGVSNRSPRLLTNPYMIKHTSPVRNVLLHVPPHYEKDTNGVVDLCVKHHNGNISYSLFHEGESVLFLKQPQAKMESPTVVETKNQFPFKHISTIEVKNAFKSYSKPARMKNENEEIWCGDLDASQTNQVELVQNFAFRLGNDIKTLFGIEEVDQSQRFMESQGFLQSQEALQSQDKSNKRDRKQDEKDSDSIPGLPTHIPLSVIADCVPVAVEDMGELDSMIEQLKAFYEDNGIQLENTTKDVLLNWSKDWENKDWALASLQQHLGTSANARQAAVILFSCMTKAANKNFIEKCHETYNGELEECNDDLRSALSEWDESLFAEATEKPQEVKTEPLPAQSSKKAGLLHKAISQSQRVSQSASQNALPSVALSPAVPLSQKSQTSKRPGSQTGSQKKKKKKGGFA